MRKTALQQYIDEIEQIQSNVPDSSKLLYQAFIDKAKSYMYEEQEQLEEAYIKGAFDFDGVQCVASSFTSGDETQFFIDNYGYNLKK